MLTAVAPKPHGLSPPPLPPNSSSLSLSLSLSLPAVVAATVASAAGRVGHGDMGTWQHFNPKGLPLPHLTYVGHTLLTGATSSDQLAAEVVRLSGLPAGTPVDLYEQVSQSVRRGAC